MGKIRPEHLPTSHPGDGGALFYDIDTYDWDGLPSDPTEQPMEPDNPGLADES